MRTRSHRVGIGGPFCGVKGKGQVGRQVAQGVHRVCGCRFLLFLKGLVLLLVLWQIATKEEYDDRTLCCNFFDVSMVYLKSISQYFVLILIFDF